MLVQAFIEQNNQGGSHQVSNVSEEALRCLEEYHWPRNVTELKQYIDAAHEQCKGATIERRDLPEEFDYALSAAQIGSPNLQQIDLSDFLERIEKELIVRALAQSENNKTKAARLLGISRARLLRRSKSLCIEDPQQGADELIDESEFKEAD